MAETATKKIMAAVIPLKGRKSKDSHKAMMNGLNKFLYFSLGFRIWDFEVDTFLNLFQFRLTEESPWFDKEYDDQDNKCVSILILTRDVTSAQALNKAEENPTDHGSPDAADSTEDSSGEGFNPRDVADKVINKAIVHGDH